MDVESLLLLVQAPQDVAGVAELLGKAGALATALVLFWFWRSDTLQQIAKLTEQLTDQRRVIAELASLGRQDAIANLKVLQELTHMIEASEASDTARHNELLERVKHVKDRIDGA